MNGSSFADLWSAEVTGPISSGAFDPQGMNYNPTGYGIVSSPTFGGGNTYVQNPGGANSTLPSLTGSGAGTNPLSGFSTPDLSAGANLSSGLPNVGSGTASQPQTQCNWYDVGCQVQQQITGPLSGAINSLSSSASDWFIRGAIIVLGFIFVAAGLLMFQQKNIVVAAKTAAKVLA